MHVGRRLSLCWLRPGIQAYPSVQPLRRELAQSSSRQLHAPQLSAPYSTTSLLIVHGNRRTAILRWYWPSLFPTLCENLHLCWREKRCRLQFGNRRRSNHYTLHRTHRYLMMPIFLAMAFSSLRTVQASGLPEVCSNFWSPREASGGLWGIGIQLS